MEAFFTPIHTARKIEWGRRKQFIKETVKQELAFYGVVYWPGPTLFLMLGVAEATVRVKRLKTKLSIVLSCGKQGSYRLRVYKSLSVCVSVCSRMSNSYCVQNEGECVNVCCKCVSQ